ncbi:hypothetical protein [Streptomyces sp. NPDC051677]|uniref:hypothetical protein n=1 Tax=Streptomyces sp. NPDC051677 TaxID=3365669 RepID=UPI0037D6E75F
MRLPTATLMTACALSAALLVVGPGGEGQKEPVPGSQVVAPAVEGRVLLTDPFDDTLGHLSVDPFDADPAEADTDSGAAVDADPGLDRGLEPAVPDAPDAPGVPDVPDEADEADSGAIGPEVVQEVPDPPDGGGLIPDGPDESDIMPG